MSLKDNFKIDLSMNPFLNLKLIGLNTPADEVDGLILIHHSLRRSESKPIPDRPPPWRNKESIHVKEIDNLLFYIQGEESR